jgi:hypothetical protein
MRRCFATPAHPPDGRITTTQEQQQDGGAQFTAADEEAFQSAIQHRAQVGGNQQHTILPPRPRGTGSSSDPVTQTLIARMNQMNITSSTDPSIAPGGHYGNYPRKDGPKKGGKPIQSAEAMEQSGKLTPMQLHRIVSSMQQDKQKWTVERVSATFSLDPTVVSSISKHLSLPIIVPDSNEPGMWDGYKRIPTNLVMLRSFQKENPTLHRLGEHIRIKETESDQKGGS